MKKSLLQLSLVFMLYAPLSLKAQSKIIWADKEKSFLEYSMHHALHDFSAKNNTINCVIDYDETANKIQKVSVSANIKDFNSGSSSRDSHAMEVLEAIQYPKVKFNSNKIEKIKNKLLITGLLTFHGVTKETKIEAVHELLGTTMQVKGNFNVSQDEFKIKRETFMMTPVDDKIDIRFEVNFAVKPDTGAK